LRTSPDVAGRIVFLSFAICYSQIAMGVDEHIWPLISALVVTLW
jgi:hypothetical protein